MCGEGGCGSADRPASPGCVAAMTSAPCSRVTADDVGIIARPARSPAAQGQADGTIRVDGEGKTGQGADGISITVRPWGPLSVRLNTNGPDAAWTWSATRFVLRPSSGRRGSLAPRCSGGLAGRRRPRRSCRRAEDAAARGRARCRSPAAAGASVLGRSVWRRCR